MAFSSVIHVTHTHKVVSLPVPDAIVTMHGFMMAQLQVVTHVIQIPLTWMWSELGMQGSVRAERTPCILARYFWSHELGLNLNFLGTPGRTARVSKTFSFL